MKRRNISGYTGTIMPSVSKLINKCKSENKEFRILLNTEEITLDINNNRMTIIVDAQGCLLRSFWG
jgi:hypothetical protein